MFFVLLLLSFTLLHIYSERDIAWLLCIVTPPPVRCLELLRICTEKINLYLSWGLCLLYWCLHCNYVQLLTLIISRSFSACGGLYHSNQGSLSSPNYPSNYPANTECVWDINVQIGYTVQLTMASDFSLQSSSGCTRDYVEVSLLALLPTVSFGFCRWGWWWWFWTPDWNHFPLEV